MIATVPLEAARRQERAMLGAATLATSLFQTTRARVGVIYVFLQRTNYYEANDDIGDYLFNILSIDAHCNYPFRIVFFNTGCLINLT